MADILVQNAVESIKTAIEDGASGYNYTTILGDTLANIVKAAMITSATQGPYTVDASAASAYICDLSDSDKISKCTCNYFGSGTSCGVTTPNIDNVWMDGSVLKGSGGTITVQSIVDLIKAIDTSAMKFLDTMYSLDTVLIKNDIYLAYLTVKSIFTTEANTNVLQNWYGIGQSANVAGAKISATNVLKVCGPSDTWCSGVGSSCTWTVPSGTSKVKFQVWGAGRGGNAACCCGGSPWSSTGAYSEMVIDAVPGEIYTVCAGCTCQKYGCSNDTPGCGCASGVTGPGICCLWADGAGCYTENCNNHNATRTQSGLGAGCYRFQNIYCSQGGACWCNYGEYCYASSCDSCGMIAVIPNCCYHIPISSACTDRNATDGTQVVHMGIMGGGCFDTNNYGRHTAPPIIDADSGLNFARPGNPNAPSYCYCAYWDSGSCCGGCAAGLTWEMHPGQGGVHSHMMGGSTTHIFDTGRGGMVQISWT